MNAVYEERCNMYNYKPAWICRTGNITTISTISKERCEDAHKCKMNTIRAFEKINKQEAMTELFSLSY